MSVKCIHFEWNRISWHAVKSGNPINLSTIQCHYVLFIIIIITYLNPFEFETVFKCVLFYASVYLMLSDVCAPVASVKYNIYATIYTISITNIENKQYCAVCPASHPVEQAKNNTLSNESCFSALALPKKKTKRAK